jgi:hypothetical protein
MSDCNSKSKDTHLATLEKLYGKEQEILDKAMERVKFADIDDMYKELMSMKGKYKDPEVFRKKAIEILNSRRQESFKKRLEVVQNQQIVQRFTEHIQQPEFKNLTEGLESILVGTPKAVEGATFNVGTIRDSNVDRYQAHLDQLFTRTEEKILLKGGDDVQKDIADIIESGFENAGDIYPREIVEIARKVKHFNDYLFVEQRKAGFDLGYVDNYVMRSYDPEKIAADPDGALAQLKESIDLDETFPGLSNQEIDKILTKVVDNIIDGDLTKGLLDVGMLDLSSRSSLEARATRSRKFVFKKGKTGAWNAAYGRNNILEGMAIKAKTLGKQNALRTVLGPNPKGMFDSLVKKAIKTAHEKGDTAQANKIRDLWQAGSNSRLRNIWANLDGSATKPGNETFAKFMANWRALEYMRLLGGSIITATTDIASMGAQLAARTDRGLMQTYASTLGTLLADSPNFAKLAITGKNKVVQDRARRFGIYFETGMGAVFRYVGIDGTANKGIAKMMNMYTRFNPIGMDAAWKKTVTLQAFSDYVSEAIQKGDIEGAIEVTLKRAGFSQEYYPALKKMVTEIKDGVQTLDINSMDKLTAKDLADLRQALSKKDPGFLGMSDKALKDKIGQQLRGMFVDVAQNGVPTPGLKQQAMLNQGTAPGTISGEMLRSVAMLKSFALKLQDSIQTVYHANPNMNENYKNTVGYIAALTGMGYVALSLADMAKGNTPRDWKKPETWRDSLIKGGAGGLYGDVLMQMLDNNYGNFTSSVAGPMVGTLDDASKLLTKAGKSMTGREGGLTAKDFNTIRQHVPFQNHFIIKPAFDALIFDSVMDQADPQRKRRIRKRLRENGQTKLFR